MEHYAKDASICNNGSSWFMNRTEIMSFVHECMGLIIHQPDTLTPYISTNRPILTHSGKAFVHFSKKIERTSICILLSKGINLIQLIPYKVCITCLSVIYLLYFPTFHAKKAT
jgi:hypothetical protein